MTVSRSGKARLESIKRFLDHTSARIVPNVGFALWDNSVVPAGLPPDAPVVAIADEGALAALLRRPTMHTFLNLWVTSRIDIRNGTLFDLASRRPAIRTREIVKRLDKGQALAVAARFLFVPRGGPWPLDAIHGDRARADGSEAANKENIHYH